MVTFFDSCAIKFKGKLKITGIASENANLFLTDGGIDIAHIYYYLNNRQNNVPESFRQFNGILSLSWIKQVFKTITCILRSSILSTTQSRNVAKSANFI